jgi:hypothetical protein
MGFDEPKREDTFREVDEICRGREDLVTLGARR